MADPANLDPNVSAYIPRNDGDLIRADEWNDVQRSARQDIQKHRHSGNASNPDDGVPIGNDGIEDNAVTREKIRNNAINNAKIEDNAITQSKIENNAITRAKIKDGSDSIVCNFPVLTDITLIEDFNKFTSDGFDVAPAITSDPVGNLHVVWQGRLVSGADDTQTIWYAKIDANGNVLIPPSSKLDSASNNNFFPSIAADLDGNLQVYWEGRDSTANRAAIFYAKLNADGAVLIGPQIKIPADQSAPSPGAPRGNSTPHVAVDSDGNTHLVWMGRDTGFNSIWYAKLNKNGQLLISPGSKLSSGNQGNNLPVVVVDSEGKVHVYWTIEISDGNQAPFHARLNTNGVIELPETLLMAVYRPAAHFVFDAVLSGDNSILVASGSLSPGFAALFGGVAFPKLDGEGNLANPLPASYFPGVQSLAIDTDGNVHIVNPFAGNIAYAKLDVEKSPAFDASLTDLLTIFKRFNFVF